MTDVEGGVRAVAGLLHYVLTVHNEVWVGGVHWDCAVALQEGVRRGGSVLPTVCEGTRAGRRAWPHSPCAKAINGTQWPEMGISLYFTTRLNTAVIRTESQQTLVASTWLGHCLVT